MNGWKHPWCTVCGTASFTVILVTWDLCNLLCLTDSLCELSEDAVGWWLAEVQGCLEWPKARMQRSVWLGQAWRYVRAWCCSERGSPQRRTQIADMTVKLIYLMLKVGVLLHGLAFWAWLHLTKCCCNKITLLLRKMSTARECSPAPTNLSVNYSVWPWSYLRIVRHLFQHDLEIQLFLANNFPITVPPCPTRVPNLISIQHLL